MKDLLVRFEISQSLFSKIFTMWINFLNVELPLLFPFPTQQRVRATMPASLHLYPTTRIIIDCTEIRVEIPSPMVAQSETWSNYKHNNTYKVLVGVSPIGCVSLFVLRFYGPVNPMGSCRARSVYLTTRLLGRLSPLSG